MSPWLGEALELERKGWMVIRLVTVAGEEVAAHLLHKLGAKINEVVDGEANKLREQVPKKGEAKVTRWLTKLHAGGGRSLRESAEKIERIGWTNWPKKIMEEAGLAVMSGSAVTGQMTLSRRFGKGRKVSTLRSQTLVSGYIQ